MLFWSKKFVYKQDKALKYTFCILYFTVQSILCLKMTDYEKQNVTWGGVRKVSRIICMTPYLLSLSSLPYNVDTKGSAGWCHRWFCFRFSKTELLFVKKRRIFVRTVLCQRPWKVLEVLFTWIVFAKPVHFRTLWLSRLTILLTRFSIWVYGVSVEFRSKVAKKFDFKIFCERNVKGWGAIMMCRSSSSLNFFHQTFNKL